MPHSSPARFAGRFIFVCLTASASRAQVSETTEVLSLEKFVVSATRTPQAISTLPSSVTLQPVAELASLQVTDLATALAREPGVYVANTGARGGLASVSIRGSAGHQTLFLVDGVRLNDRSAVYDSFLGGADLGSISAIEVLRGPQSTLYGSSAMGGAIRFETERGQGAPHRALTAMGGSFSTYGGSARTAGATGAWSYSASVSGYATENDRPDNAYRVWNYATRLEYTVSKPLQVGLTFRANTGDYTEPGSRLFPSIGDVDADTYLTTLYADYAVNEAVSTRLTLGWHRRLYTYASAYGVSDLSNTRRILDWQTSWKPRGAIEVVGGVNFEGSHFKVLGQTTKDAVGAGFVSATVRPTQAVTLTAGLRYDDFDSVGDATTWRTGVAWRVATATKLRATFGTGFTAPGSDDRFGVPAFGQLGNPDLKPEKARGFDLGVDQSFANEKIVVSATYFFNRFTDLFEYETVNFATYEGRVTNRARATTQGLEFGAAFQVTTTVKATLSYTYLDAQNDSDQRRLIRRPRHVVHADGTWQATPQLLVGAGVHAVASRLDAGTRAEDYTTVRVFGQYALRENLWLKLRVENLLDEAYEDVVGYAALPLGVFGGVEWHF